VSGAEAVERIAPQAQGASRRLRAHLATPLHRDAYALVVNSAFTAGTGVLYWIFAAKTYSEHAVGINAALISSMMFLAGVASLDLPNLIVRFLPGAGTRTSRYVVLCYLGTGLIAALAATVFLVGVRAWAPRLGDLRSSFGLEAWFVVATVAWCLFVIQDGVLTALGRAVLVPVENAVFSVAKLLLLVAVAGLAPIYGIFISWTAAMVLTVLGVNAFILARLARRRPAAAVAGAMALRGRNFARYCVADYGCAVAWLAAANLTPLVVTGLAGAKVNAHYALAWAIALPLYSVSANIGTSLVLHAVSDHDDAPALVRKALRQGIVLLVPAVTLVVALASPLLSLFGSEYAEHGATLLRLLAAGALVNVVTTLGVSVARVEGRLGKAVWALSVQAALALGLTAVLIGPVGVTGAGIAWLVSELVVAAGLLATGALRPS